MSEPYKHILSAFILIILATSGCFRNPRGDADTEFRLLMENQYSASGSDLTFETCGWPVNGRMRLKSLSINLFPDSSLKDGRGYADISAEGEGFSCGGKLFFIYGYSYTGGHGYSGGTDLRLNLIQRETEVDRNVSDPPVSTKINTGIKIKGQFAASGTSLPDNTPADFYSLELNGSSPGIKIITESKDRLNIKGCVYQNNKLISTLTGSGIKLRPGRVIILVTAGGKTGDYSITVEELSEAEKSLLR